VRGIHTYKQVDREEETCDIRQLKHTLQEKKEKLKNHTDNDTTHRSTRDWLRWSKP